MRWSGRNQLEEVLGLSEEDAVVWWLSRLTGIPTHYFPEALAQIRSWGIAHVTATLCDHPTGDEFVAAVLLSEDIETLGEAGVPEDALLARLGRDRDVWPTWAEIHSASVIARFLGSDCKVKLDVPAQSGRNADFAFHEVPGEDPVHVEFKALGLSDAERRFCKHCTPILRRIQPSRGVAILQHESVDGVVPEFSDAQAHHMEEQAAKWWRLPPRPFRDLSASVSVAHDTVEHYIRRLSLRIDESLSQLPEDKQGWVAFHWTNGAPRWLVRKAIARVNLPQSIQGLMFVGSAIVLDGILHNFWLEVPKEVESDRVMLLDSRVRLIRPRSFFSALDRSASVRATVLRVPTCNGLREVFVRDGSTGFWPFVLILGADPVAMLPPRRFHPFNKPQGPVWTNPRAQQAGRYRIRRLR